MGLMDKIFGTHSQHELKRIYPIVDRIEALEPEMKALSDNIGPNQSRRKLALHRIVPRINVGRKCPIFLVGRWSIINPTNGSLMASRKRAIRNSVRYRAARFVKKRTVNIEGIRYDFRTLGKRTFIF
jgi:hypothetical protein